MLKFIDQGTALLAAALRFGSGVRVGQPGPRPDEPLTLYEFEGCPYCRKVREALTFLDLDVDVRPCPKGGARFRPTVIGSGGKAQFPFLVDPNTGQEMYESDAIIRYLFRFYGTGRPPLLLAMGPVTDVMVQLAMIPRHGRGVRARPSRPVERQMELHGNEASPGTLRVRESLCTLEIPYRMVQATPGSESRSIAKAPASVSIPRLSDPNTGEQHVGTENILDYLARKYAA